ncbi:bifunctional UMP-synthetase [Heterostelium album PN500]|uniref:Uridine 5'-monophosphate synthase n=1 Tax=Heterostelium pallidum (strain ATCC 26659 / Pp 5 / PN500) TaxID=670386 RepID=D3BE93_HETP5|nr:bifunctional UMP-synthetase [Heterostelium album PN500]EFA80224.1 bifunctional UMP-synthetase [Heterostelium album PN500]|eukprot:XP_020432344.1 bifunctional UMP-synthetase [Heterostelium album PN500]
MDLNTLVSRLHEINAVKLGQFKLKSGIMSPIYIDLRVTVSSPVLLSQIAEMMYQKVSQDSSMPPIVCGVPYTALPIATAMSIAHDTPMVMRRKEAKNYGTAQLIEGRYKAGDNVLVVEDLVTSGASVLETVRDLNASGLVVTDVVVLLDRQQGARQELAKHGLKLHSVITMEELIDTLTKQGKLDEPTLALVNSFLEANRAVTVPAASQMPAAAPAPKPAKKYLTYEERAKLATNPTASKLFNIMATKKTNLAVAVDLTRKQEVLNLADSIGSEICVLKTHVDIIDDYDQDFVHQLEQIASKHNFLIFEDRKFADIGNTVKYQFESGVYHISKWAHMVTIHGVAGPAIIDGFRDSIKQTGAGLLLLAQMSSKGSLCVGEYTNQMIEMGKQNSDAVMGFICQERLESMSDNFVLMTPGIQFNSKGDSMGQQYNTPDYVVKEKGTDVIIVGRGIYQNSEPKSEAIKYKQAAWAAYESRLN